jgi:putative redox protein
MGRAVTVRTIDHLKTEARVGPHALLADEPADKGGTDTGPTPMELLLAALGT